MASLPERTALRGTQESRAASRYSLGHPSEIGQILDASDMGGAARNLAGRVRHQPGGLRLTPLAEQLHSRHGQAVSS